MEKLLHWDTELLLAINSHHTPFWDKVMWYCSQSWVWIPLYLLMVYAIYKVTVTILNKNEKDDKRKLSNMQVFLVILMGVACIGIAAGLSDFITSGLLKKWICRPRPTHSGIASMLHIVNHYTGGKYGFPSSHAANTCAVATAYWMVIGYLANQPHRVVLHDTIELVAVKTLSYVMNILVVLYIALNCYSRMYLGVHYPLDILCGAVIGIVMGLLLGYLFRLLYLPIGGKQKKSVQPVYR